jgi:polysaccharide pyruvyl transferase WcaK-like protein
MRLHAAILSAISLVPSFGLIYDPKVFNFLERIGTAEHSVCLQDLKGGEELAKKLASWLAARRDLSRLMEPRVARLKELARRNAVIAGELLLAKAGLHKK